MNKLDSVIEELHHTRKEVQEMKSLLHQELALNLSASTAQSEYRIDSLEQLRTFEEETHRHNGFVSIHAFLFLN